MATPSRQPIFSEMTTSLCYNPPSNGSFATPLQPCVGSSLTHTNHRIVTQNPPRFITAAMGMKKGWHLEQSLRMDAQPLQLHVHINL